jgi:polyisoprenyl-phosphate glycosyltransferase
MAAAPDQRPTISVVIPLYDEEAVLPILHERLSCALAAEASYEIVLVDDGSRDGTLPLLRDLAGRDPRLVVLALSRNFGHQAAVTAGLEAASGEAVILMDGDLQDPPEIIPDLLRAWREGYQVVVARRRSRQDRGLRGFLFRIFHRLFGLISDFPIDADAGIFSLLDRRAAGELIGLRERNRFLPGMRSWIGFRQTTVWYDRAARAAGEPKQTLGRLLRYGFDAVFSFSYKPLRLSWLFGLVVSSLAFTYGTVLVVMRILRINVVLGFTTPTVAVFFLGGIQLIMIGILGEYLGRIYDEVKRRPHYLVAERIAHHDRPGHAPARSSDGGPGN